MDEVLERFESVLKPEEVSKDEELPYRESLYKNWGKLGNQEDRRREILEIQKSNRNNKLDKFRGILELVNAVEVQDIFKEKRRAYYRPNIYVAGFNKTSPTYNNVLMLSEWMIEKPHDFNENWYVVPCPKGVRMLVVAIQGSTKAYTKFGHFKFSTQTLLPGGQRPLMKNQCCVLDCFYNETINTMFVLDLLAWNSQPMTDGETEFRHFWLESQLSELKDLKTMNKKNQVIFKLLPKTPCDPESFQKFMMTYPPFENHFPVLDGLLFYHKRAHYVSGQTPLVGWLYPFMVPEVLGEDIKINGAYAVEKPEDYVSQADYIEKFEEKMNKKKNRKRLDSAAMDTADASKVEDKTTKKNNRRSKKKVSQSATTETMEAEETVEKEGKVENEEKMENEETTEKKETTEKFKSPNDNGSMDEDEVKQKNEDLIDSAAQIEM